MGGGLLALYFFTARPEGQKLIAERVPRLDDLFNPVESNIGQDKEEYYEKSKEKAAKLDVDSSKLIGAWHSKWDNGELLTFRSDGMCRIAIAAKFESKTPEGNWNYADCRAVFLAHWTLREGMLSVHDLKVTKFEITDFHTSNNLERDNIEKGRARDAKRIVRGEAAKLLNKNMGEIAGHEAAEMAVVKLTSEVLMMVDKTGVNGYERVDPYTTRDPNGADAPTFISNGDGQYERKDKKVRKM